MVGLRNLGQPMARRHIDQSWPFVFFARRPEVTEGFTRRGGTGKRIAQIREVFARKGIDIEKIFPVTLLLVEAGCAATSPVGC